MKNVAMCVIDGTISFNSLQPLLKQRCVAALPFAGRYRLIDFSLSNATHSGVTNVAIFPEGDYYSLSEHIQSGKFWGLNRKVDGLSLFPPKKETAVASTSLSFRRMCQYIDYFLKSRQKYVILYRANIITTLKFEELMSSHIQSDAEVTQVYYHNKPVEIFVMSRTYLIDLILRHDVSPYQTMAHFVEMCEGLKINAYEHAVYTRGVDSLLSYYRANLDILHAEYGSQVFSMDRPVLTQTRDEVPTFYTNQADVSNSLIANGCLIEGKVENSIIFRGVKVKRGAIVRNSVVLPKTYIAENSIIEQVIADKYVHIGNEAWLKGQDYAPIVVGRNQRIMGNKEFSIAHISTECVPFYKTGGLADVTFGLTQELVVRGLSVDIILPYLNSFPKRYRENLTHEFQSTIVMNELDIAYDVYRYSKEGINYYFISFGEMMRDQLYGYDDDCTVYELYNFIVVNYIEKSRLHYDVIHCHDWLTGLIPYFAKQKDYFKYTKTVFTIHNIQYQGICEVQELKIISQLESVPEALMFHKKVNFMKAALVLADEITTVSKRYRNEICYPYFAEGLDEVIATRKDHLHGILNGIDYSNHDPATDLSIFKRYNWKTVALKQENKCQMQRELNLPVDQSIPVIGMVSRIIEQKGFDLIVKVFPELMEEEMQFILLGDGKSHYIKFLKEMALKYPDKVSINLGYHSYHSQMIYAGSDLFLMPSRFEPCGTSQMIALKYGSIPIVHETGGLRDTITPYNEFTGYGNGFGFAHHTAHDMLFTIKRALAFYQTPEHWHRLVYSAMTQDWSWEKSTTKYINLYRKLINEI